jgi:hypothetical protein
MRADQKVRRSVSTEENEAGRWSEQESKLKQLGGQPVGRRAGYLAQDCGAPGLPRKWNRAKRRQAWEFCLAQRKDSSDGVHADRGGSRPESAQRLDWRIEA